MDGQAIKEVVGLVERGMTVEVLGRTYSPKELHPVSYDPRPSGIVLHTLTGLSDFVAANVDGLDLPACLVHVEATDRVSLITEVYGDRNQRDERAVVKFEHIRPFSFNEWIPLEDFKIRLLGLFVERPERQDLMEFVSNIRMNDDANIIDDGVAQTVTVASGVSGALSDTASPPRLVRLRPYRTFPEVEQPESDFAFRLKKNERLGVVAALFDVDGGAWQDEARRIIVETLRSMLPKELAIIA